VFPSQRLIQQRPLQLPPEEPLPADLPPLPLRPPPRNACPDPLPLEEGALKDRSILGEAPRKPISLRLPEFPAGLNPLPRPEDEPNDRLSIRGGELEAPAPPPEDLNERNAPPLPELSERRKDPLPELIESVRPRSIPRSVIPAAPALPLPEEEVPLFPLRVGAILSLDPPEPLDVMLSTLFPDVSRFGP